MKLERYDKDMYRVVNGGVIIGFASRLSNGFWAACDVDDSRLTRKSFVKPKDVMDWFALRDGGANDRP